METALDTNVLVLAHRSDALLHAEAKAALLRRVQAGEELAVPWPCIYEFLKVCTHRRVFPRPSTLAEAMAFLDALLGHPLVRTLSETDRHVGHMEAALRASAAIGSMVHDAHVVALMQEHGITEILTQDRDFHRFPGVRVVRLHEVST